ncbi:uncharacterized protein V6R79_017024 [Siganus canaliculatus]
MDVQDFSQSSLQRKLMRLWSSEAKDWRGFAARRVQVELEDEEARRNVEKPSHDLSNNEDKEMAFRIVQLLMVHEELKQV